MASGQGILLRSMPDVVAEPTSRASRQFRRYALVLMLCVPLPALLLAAFVVGVDPYYVFGSPSWRGINVVRPFYEPHVIIAKPYQVRRLRPEAVALGSSRVEVGIDPRHPGWATPNVFNFALPSSNSYAVMLAFLHAQKLSAPLRQAVVGLDFFAYNIDFPLSSDLAEQRFAHGISEDFDTFLQEIYPDRRSRRHIPKTGIPVAAPSPGWNEALYLAVNPDVAAAVARKEFKSGREHYELAGRAERRLGGTIPANWDEAGYLQVHPDVAYAVFQGVFVSGYHHYLAAGRVEGRLGGFQPEDWDEAGYLAANPSARIQIALGRYRTGYLHYAAFGRSQGLLGFAPATAMEKLRLRWPALNQTIFQLEELFRLIFSATSVRAAVRTVLQQSEPAAFDDMGMRVWRGREDVVRQMGGSGALVRKRLLGGQWRPWLTPPGFIYCFTNPDSGATMFDPFRFMLRRAYAEGTDLRLYITPLHAAVRKLLVTLGLEERYEFWLKELVRINEEEAARAGRHPSTLWDFSDLNSVTREPVPSSGDPTPMRWHWDHSHYRQATGDLILDRIFDHHDPARVLPADFGVRLTAANIDAHIARSKAGLDAWTAANPELASQIIDAVRTLKAENRQSQATCW